MEKKERSFSTQIVLLFILATLTVQEIINTNSINIYVGNRGNSNSKSGDVSRNGGVSLKSNSGIVGGYTVLKNYSDANYKKAYSGLIQQHPELYGWRIGSVQTQIAAGINYQIVLISLQGKVAYVVLYLDPRNNVSIKSIYTSNGYQSGGYTTLTDLTDSDWIKVYSYLLSIHPELSDWTIASVQQNKIDGQVYRVIINSKKLNTVVYATLQVDHTGNISASDYQLLDGEDQSEHTESIAALASPLSHSVGFTQPSALAQKQTLSQAMITSAQNQPVAQDLSKTQNKTAIQNQTAGQNQAAVKTPAPTSIKAQVKSPTPTPSFAPTPYFDPNQPRASISTAIPIITQHLMKVYSIYPQLKSYLVITRQSSDSSNAPGFTLTFQTLHDDQTNKPKTISVVTSTAADGSILCSSK